MGKYSLWLAYRERDQFLRQQLSQIEEELLDLYQQGKAMQPLPSLDENTIAQALLMYQPSQAQPAVPETQVAQPEEEGESTFPDWLRRVMPLQALKQEKHDPKAHSNRLVDRWLSRWRKNNGQKPPTGGTP